MSNRINNVHGWFRRLPKALEKEASYFREDKPVTFWTIVVFLVVALVCGIIWPSVGIAILLGIGGLSALIFIIWWVVQLFEENLF